MKACVVMMPRRTVRLNQIIDFKATLCSNTTRPHGSKEQLATHLMVGISDVPWSNR